MPTDNLSQLAHKGCSPVYKLTLQTSLLFPFKWENVTIIPA